jgi:hypothetical protein
MNKPLVDANLFTPSKTFIRSIVTELFYQLNPFASSHLTRAVTDPAMELLYQVCDGNAIERYLV